VNVKADIDFGKCCACQGTENVRNIMMLDKLAPVLGTGWGCVVCNLPPDGAICVVCDGCLESGAAMTEVCMGFPKDKIRVPIHALADKEFGHDLSFHPEVVRQ